VENIRAFVQKYKVASYIIGLGFIVFINCFGFPFYNLTKEWSFSITAINIYLILASAWAIGGFLYALFPNKKATFIVAVLVAFACLGLACRYLLEFGEVSNTYNFTLPNIALHLSVFLVVCVLSWFYLLKRNSR